MTTEKHNELTAYVTQCYDATKTDLNLLLSNMQPLQIADTESVNAQIQKVHENIISLRYAAVLCLGKN